MLKRPEPVLTEHEGMLLAMIARRQPVTAHQLYKVLAASPTSSINASKGQLYPAVRRLKAHGMVNVVPVADDARGTEQLSVSELGLAALRAWVLRIDCSHVVLDDPLRTRVLSFDVLSKDEQLVWIAKAKELVKTKRQLVDEYNNNSEELPYNSSAHSNCSGTLAAKMEWLDELLFEVAEVRSSRASV